MKELKIADGLSLPLEVVTQTVSILAKRRAGKSYAMRRFAEQLFKRGQQIVIIDPKGDQWGIRSSPDGRSPGLPVVILGGERADVPLEVHSGEIVAKLVVEDRVSVLLDLSLFRKHEVATFMTGFLENLYRLKAREIYRTPMMLVIDEADAIAPQKPQKGEERMLGAAEDIVRRGGQRGIGCTLVTQRSAVLNKNVLTQSQILVVLRTIAPQDLSAIDAWIDVHGTEEERKLLKASLPSLPVGDAWFWSPGWPSADGIFERVHVLPIETFDSAATPKPGEKRIEPKNLADVDLDVLKKQMAATIERAKADNPKELKKQIAELKRAKGVPDAATVERAVAKAVDDAQREWKRIEQENARAIQDLRGRLDKIAHLATLNGNAPAIAEYKPVKPQIVVDRSAPPARKVATGSSEIGQSGLRRILIALAQRPQGLSVGQIGVRANLSSKSGTFDTYLSRARSNGWIVGDRHHLQITDEGLEALGDYDPLPTGDALLQHWLSHLGNSGASRILTTLVHAWPNSLTKTEVAEGSNLAMSGTFDTYISRLRSLELIAGRGELKASDELFD